MSTAAVPVPSWMIGGDLLGAGGQLLGDPEMKLDKETKELKTSKGFPGLTPWAVTVEWSRGTRTKVKPDGSTMSLPVFEQTPVTIWTEGDRPAVKLGDYVRLVTPMIGAVNGSVYVQALGLKKLDVKAAQA